MSLGSKDRTDGCLWTVSALPGLFRLLLKLAIVVLVVRVVMEFLFSHPCAPTLADGPLQDPGQAVTCTVHYATASGLEFEFYVASNAVNSFVSNVVAIEVAMPGAEPRELSLLQVTPCVSATADCDTSLLDYPRYDNSVIRGFFCQPPGQRTVRLRFREGDFVPSRVRIIASYNNMLHDMLLKRRLR